MSTGFIEWPKPAKTSWKKGKLKERERVRKRDGERERERQRQREWIFCSYIKFFEEYSTFGYSEQWPLAKKPVTLILCIYTDACNCETTKTT